jgi:hypothetical protein
MKRRGVGRTVAALLLGAGVLFTSGCTPTEIALYNAVTESHSDALSGGQLEQLRSCEAGGDYAAVSVGGRYRGAYQFNQTTWDAVASRNYGWLIGTDPAAADPWWQDAMARALFAERGAAPWPVCGRSL